MSNSLIGWDWSLIHYQQLACKKKKALEKDELIKKLVFLQNIDVQLENGVLHTDWKLSLDVWTKSGVIQLEEFGSEN